MEIDNMSNNDSPPKLRKKRQRSINRSNSSSEERSPEHMRRRVGSPLNPRESRYSEYNEFDFSGDLDRSRSAYEVLCVSGLHPKASDEQVKEILHQVYRKFGEISVKISHELDERVVYVRFRSSEDARDAINSKTRIILFDKLALVAPYYKSRSSGDHYESRARISRSRSFSPGYDQHQHMSSVNPRLHGSHSTNRFYQRTTLPFILPRRDLREMGLPPLYPYLYPIHPLYGPPIRFMPPFKPRRLINKEKKKFPNYVHHIPPEYDPSATRTLFIGNLDPSVSEEDLRCLFGEYGVVENVDIKQHLRRKNSAYAFVRYQNLDMAIKAKVELSGRCIGQLVCKIGYGNPTPSQRIWVGGFVPSTSSTQLQREFDRFGVIEKIEHFKGDTFAYIQFQNINEATAAVKDMRGVTLDGQENKLRTDFANYSVCETPTLTHSSTSKSYDDVAATTGDLQELTQQDKYTDNGTNSECSSNRPSSFHKDYETNSIKLGDYNNERLFKHSVSNIGSPQSPESSLHQKINSDVEFEEGAIQSAGSLDSVRTLNDLAKCSEMWQGIFLLKNAQFPVNFHLTSGDSSIIESMIKDDKFKSMLCITQRLHLDENKWEHVSELIVANMHAIFLAMPSSTTPITNDNASEQNRPLRTLIYYLKRKEVAGVISLVGKDPKSTLSLYIFPPCMYSANFLKQNAKNLSSETLKDDHLVVVAIKEVVQEDYETRTPSQRIWVSGFVPSTSPTQLQREFDRFGVIEKIEHFKGDTFAYIQFQNINEATAAVKDMRGVTLEGQENKLRTDFANYSVCETSTLTHSSTSKSYDDVAATTEDLQESTQQDKYTDNETNSECSSNRPSSFHKDYETNSIKLGDYNNERLFKHSVSNIGSSQSPESSLHQKINSDVESEERAIQSAGPLDFVRTLNDLAKCSVMWQGRFLLKNFQFPANFHITSGDSSVIESMIKGDKFKSMLYITQRFHLDGEKLEHVSKLIGANMHAIVLAMPSSTTPITNDNASEQNRPLRTLIYYLKRKEVAGVISLVGEDPKSTFLLYIFPPCMYSANFLKQNAKNLSTETLKDDHLVVVAMRGVIQ